MAGILIPLSSLACTCEANVSMGFWSDKRALLFPPRSANLGLPLPSCTCWPPPDNLDWEWDQNRKTEPETKAEQTEFWHSWQPRRGKKGSITWTVCRCFPTVYCWLCCHYSWHSNTSSPDTLGPPQRFCGTAALITVACIRFPRLPAKLLHSMDWRGGRKTLITITQRN